MISKKEEENKRKGRNEGRKKEWKKEWKKRKNGEIPDSSLCLFSDVRAKVPDMVLNLLESKVMTPDGLLKRKRKDN